MATLDERQYLLANALSTPEGRHEVAQTILEPFKEGRDYVAIGRKLMFVDHLPQGAPAWWSFLQTATTCNESYKLVKQLYAGISENT